MPKIHKNLCRAAAQSLFTAIESPRATPQDLDPLKHHEQLYLSNLTFGQQKYLVEKADQFVKISLDIEALRQKLSEVKNMESLRDLEDTYLLLGAPLCMMRRLFGLHAAEFSHRRKLLGIAGSSNGRPRQCGEDTEHIVWKLWVQHQDLDERARFLKIAEVTDLDLHQIWSALREHLK
ncbi:STY4526/YPO1902 family pathogenicity island replication protein [Pseudoteredinibacter isoporae]|uniref:DUF2857 domain-containing protein n=1 Tax=Pseudoteredinibacter isoporae TaxID=570281 RepID=A0A7X0MYC9_9GAMM|nr:STY4526/YPO1902 family pathogenicity island replication protein [Pseudoteredinibacter isoporae]MBB6521882.1 hypothetical protein [Pseudoteredinibacter isoporae]NHO87426.1 DUF2857 family protein [Pseudoteredinibacter isoporae]NIB24243.1 DUF2857 family protein [Pseudoteredinibacter isoporae]